MGRTGGRKSGRHQRKGRERRAGYRATPAKGARMLLRTVSAASK